MLFQPAALQKVVSADLKKKYIFTKKVCYIIKHLSAKYRKSTKLFKSKKETV